MTNDEAASMMSRLKNSLAEYCGLNKNGIRAFDLAIKALEAQDATDTNVGSTISRQPEPHWIPVSERLPDKEGNYLITAQPTYNHAKDIRIAHWSSRWVGYVKSEIIAWMPLPEPYWGES